MTLQFNTTLRNTWLDAITTAVSTSGKLRVYDGTPPASAGAALSGNNLLVDMPCSATFAAAASGGVLTVNSITQTNASATGTATFFRVYNNGATTCYIQGTVATSGGDATINTTTITTGGPVVISSFTITAPGA